jgi:hypothetical protein
LDSRIVRFESSDNFDISKSFPAVSPKTDPPKGVWRHKNDVFCTPFNEIDNVDTNLTQQEGTE